MRQNPGQVGPLHLFYREWVVVVEIVRRLSPEEPQVTCRILFSGGTRSAGQARQVGATASTVAQDSDLAHNYDHEDDELGSR